MSLLTAIQFPRTQEHAPLTTQEPIALDPAFVEQVETFLPLDQGVGNVAAEALKAYGVQEFMSRGVDRGTAISRTERIAAELPGLGNFVSNNIPEDERAQFEATAAPKDIAAKVALGAVYTLARRQPDTYYGSQAASFVSHVDKHTRHVRLG